MLTPSRWFFIRLKQHYRYIYKTINSVLDWTVWVYLAIPALVVGIGLYVDLWRSFPPWADGLPWELLFMLVMYLNAVSGKLHIGLDRADQLLLVQRTLWLNCLKRWGLGYSVVMLAIKLILPVVLFLPFLLQASQIQSEQLSMLLAYGYLTAVAMLLINHFLLKDGSWWIKLARLIVRLILAATIWIVPVTGYLFSGWQLVYSFIALLFLVLVLLWRYRRAPLQYALQLRQEQDFRTKLTALILSQVHENHSAKRWQRPWIFRKSQRMFKKADAAYVIAELRIKSLLRSVTLLSTWGSVLSVGSYALFLVDGSGVWVVLVGLVFINRVWLTLQWNQWAAEQYVQLYVKQFAEIRHQAGNDKTGNAAAELAKAGHAHRAKRLSQNLLTIPGLVIWLLVISVKYLWLFP